MMQSHGTPASDPAPSADSLDGLSRVAVNGATLAYREHGTGEPVVFVHGSVSDIRTWEQPLAAIGEAHRALAYSRRYARPNDDIPPGVDDRMLPHVEDLASLLQALDAAPAHLVGHSWGAFICLLTAIHHPPLVRTLVLEEPPVVSLYLSTPPRATELLTLLARRPKTASRSFASAPERSPRRRRRWGKETTRRHCAGSPWACSAARATAGCPRSANSKCARTSTRSAHKCLGAGFPPLAEEHVRGVTAPTLLITGERTPAFRRHLSDRLYQLLPGAEGIGIAGASHRLHEENPTAVNEAILTFINEHL